MDVNCGLIQAKGYSFHWFICGRQGISKGGLSFFLDLFRKYSVDLFDV